MMNNAAQESKSESPGTRMSLVEALNHAQALQRSEKIDAAESIYVEILEQIPDEPNALVFLGILRHQQQRSDEAIKLLSRATELVPDAAGPWLNLGNVLIEAQQFQLGAEALRRSLELNPSSASVYNNLGVAQLRGGHLADSEEAFLAGLKLEPDRTDLHFNYARMLHNAKRSRESIAHSIRALEINPDLASSRQLLSISYFVLGERDKAIANIMDWMAREPDNPLLGHMLASVGGAEVPRRADDEYVAKTFDEFASSFDSKLGQLGYKAPQLVVEALSRIQASLPPSPVVVDAGCGTGLCGPLLKPMVGRLVGIDLSSGMLERAEARNVYDSLEKVELTAFLQRHPGEFDLIVSADTLCYFGDLSGFLAAGFDALGTQGAVIFSLESSDDDAADFHLHVHGRYSHSRHYVLESLDRQGFDLVSADPVVLRMEMNEPVHGWVVTAMKRHQDGG